MAALVIVTVLAAGQTVFGSPNSRPGLPAEKLELLQREDQLRDQTPLKPKPQSPQAHGPAIPADAEWPEGIFDDGEFPSSDYVFVNRWTGTMQGRHVTVYAGSYASNPSRGLVLVMTVSLDLKEVQAREYPAPGLGGPVRVVEAHGLRLVLAAAGGSRLGFDLTSRSFVAV